MFEKTEADEELYIDFTERLSESTVILTSAEVRIIKLVQNDIGATEGLRWTPMDEDLFFPKQKIHKDGTGVGVGRRYVVGSLSDALFVLKRSALLSFLLLTLLR